MIKYLLLFTLVQSYKRTCILPNELGCKLEMIKFYKTQDDLDLTRTVFQSKIGGLSLNRTASATNCLVWWFSNGTVNDCYSVSKYPPSWCAGPPRCSRALHYIYSNITELEEFEAFSNWVEYERNVSEYNQQITVSSRTVQEELFNTLVRSPTCVLNIPDISQLDET